MLVEFHVCNFSFPKQVNHRLVCFQVCKHMKQLFLYQTYESYIGTLIISRLQTYEMAIFICLRFFLFKTYESYVGKIHVCKHMKQPFSYV